jgi:carbon monoxide dehydrogenase subunit G
MQIENSFEVAAPPDEVYKFLLDVHRVVSCVPGAELAEVVDADTFKGRVKIKVGPVTVAYAGTARIVDRDEATRAATLQGEGRETTGPGSAKASSRMTVHEDGAGSKVVLQTDFTVAGRVAQFGRGLMEDVSRSLVNQMATCIKSQLETTAAPAATAAAEAPAGTPAETAAGEPPTAAPGPGATTPAAAPAAPPPANAPVNALALFWQVLVARIKRLFGARTAS